MIIKSNESGLIYILLFGGQYGSFTLYAYNVQGNCLNRFLVESWKPCLNISYGPIHKLFARASSGSTSLSETSVVGIQVMGILLANGISPYQLTTSVSEQKFFEDLARNLNSRQKQVCQPAAEVSYGGQWGILIKRPPLIHILG